MELRLQTLMFSFGFHTGFIKKNYLCFPKREVDRACKDEKHFRKGFKIEVFFSELEEQQEIQSKNNEKKRESRTTTCSRCSALVTEGLRKGANLIHWSCINCSVCKKPLDTQENIVIAEGEPTCISCCALAAEFFHYCQVFISFYVNINKISVLQRNY